MSLSAAVSWTKPARKRKMHARLPSGTNTRVLAWQKNVLPEMTATEASSGTDCMPVAASANRKKLVGIRARNGVTKSVHASQIPNASRSQILAQRLAEICIIANVSPLARNNVQKIKYKTYVLVSVAAKREECMVSVHGNHTSPGKTVNASSVKSAAK